LLEHVAVPWLQAEVGEPCRLGTALKSGSGRIVAVATGMRDCREHKGNIDSGWSTTSPPPRLSSKVRVEHV
jgi:hypothetical protein